MKHYRFVLKYKIVFKFDEINNMNGKVSEIHYRLTKASHYTNLRSTLIYHIIESNSVNGYYMKWSHNNWLMNWRIANGEFWWRSGTIKNREPATVTTRQWRRRRRQALDLDVFSGETPQRGVAVHQWPSLIRFMQRFSPDFTRCCPDSCQ